MIHIPIKFNDFDDGDLPQSPNDMNEIDLGHMRAEQQCWARRAVKDRAALLSSVRRRMVKRSADLVRSQCPCDEIAAAEILSSQVIPLADACRFIECEAARVLRPRRHGARGRPLWLMRSAAEVQREPWGIVLIVAPSNYPLFIMGVSLLQALAAGNAVLLKPAPGSSPSARLLRDLCIEAGVPSALILVLAEDSNCVRSAITAGVNKVLFTGSANTGRRVLSDLAPHLVPATMELSGCDAMFVLADADAKLAAQALVFGLTLNRGATCIAPRRVFIHQSQAAAFERELLGAAASRDNWSIDPTDARTLADLVVRAAAGGARLVLGEVDHHGAVTAPVIVGDAQPGMAIMSEDHFGPAAALMVVASDEEALRANECCRYALGASIFSRDLKHARELANRIQVGSVTINDVIVPTADPRLPFGGRGESGYGVMRGSGGLLELTVPKVIVIRHGSARPHLEPPSAVQAQFLARFLQFSHASSWIDKIAAAWRLIRAAQNLNRS